MRRPRFTYLNAYHHLMNVGINGEPIFQKAADKAYFIQQLKHISKRSKIRILAYCLLDTHYHMVLQNSSGKLSDFVKKLNSDYGNYYRQKYGGKGAVFRGRYKSTVLQKGTYLNMSLFYLYLNPVRTGIALHPFAYQWSGIQELFNKKITKPCCDTKFVETLLGSKANLVAGLSDAMNKKIPVGRNLIGEYLGEPAFAATCEKKAARENKEGLNEKEKQKLVFDTIFKPPDRVIREFEQEKDIRFDSINKGLKFKRLRGELLVRLKDTSGLTYTQIKKSPIFDGLKASSMGQIYRNNKNRLEGK
ncbi:MAG: hypothetical protein GY757_17545 [bacterium]|nr:hypothetical protein [bacterium]